LYAWIWEPGVSLTICEAATMRPIHPLRGHKGDVLAVAVTRDGRRIVSAGADATVRIWDFPSGRALRTLRGHAGPVCAVAVTPDGARVLSGGADRTIRLWDTESGVELRTLQGHENEVTSLAAAWDGRRAVSGSADATVRVWDLVSGSELSSLHGHQGRVTSVDIAADGRVVSGGVDQTARVWDPDVRQSTPHARTGGATPGLVQALAITPDGKRIISAHFLGSLCVLDAATGQVERSWTAHDSWLNDVTVTPDGSCLVSASHDGTVKVWGMNSGRELQALRVHEEYSPGSAGGDVTRVCVTADGRVFAGTEHGKIKVWMLVRGAPLGALDERVHYYRPLIALAAFPDGERLLSADGSLAVIWDLRSNGDHVQHVDLVRGAIDRVPIDRLDHLRLESGQVHLHAMAISPDGRRLAWFAKLPLSGGPILGVSDADSGRLIHAMPERSFRSEFWEDPTTRNLSWSTDGRRIVFAGQDRTVQVWDAETGRLVTRFPFLSGMTCATRGELIAAGGPDGGIHLLELRGVEIGPTVVTPGNQRGRYWFRCPGCALAVEIAPEALGTEVVCQQCSVRLRLNPFAAAS
jgi:WD40 repeat protein